MKFSGDRGKMSLPRVMDIIKDADGNIKVIPAIVKGSEKREYYKPLIFNNIGRAEYSSKHD